jgi:hypothetical protein
MSEQDKDPRQNVPCVFFRKGSCRNGASCPFLHELKSPTAEKSAAEKSTAPTKAPAPRNIIVELKPGSSPPWLTSFGLLSEDLCIII